MFLRTATNRVYDDVDMVTEGVSARLLNKLSSILTSVQTTEDYFAYLDNKVITNLVLNKGIVYDKKTLKNDYNVDFDTLKQLPVELRVPSGYLFLDDIVTEGMRSLIIPPTVKHISRLPFAIKYQIESIIFELPEMPAYTKMTHDNGSADWFCVDKLFGDYSKLKTLVLPDYVPSIAAGLCVNCDSLEDFRFPLNISEIGNAAFRNCTALTQVDLSKCKYLRNIVLSAFENCFSMEEVRFPKSLTTIGAYAFLNCTSLRKVVIPSSVRTIDMMAFYNCKNVKGTFVLPQTLVNLGRASISDMPIETLVMSVDLFFDKIRGMVGGLSDTHFITLGDMLLDFLPKTLRKLVLRELNSDETFEMIKSNFSILTDDNYEELLAMCNQYDLANVLLQSCPELKSITLPEKYAVAVARSDSRIDNRKKDSSAVVYF